MGSTQTSTEDDSVCDCRRQPGKGSPHSHARTCTHSYMLRVRGGMGACQPGMRLGTGRSKADTSQLRPRDSRPSPGVGTWPGEGLVSLK